MFSSFWRMTLLSTPSFTFSLPLPSFFLCVLFVSFFPSLSHPLPGPAAEREHHPPPSSSRHHALISPPSNFEHIYHMSLVSADLYLQKEPATTTYSLQHCILPQFSSSPSTSSLGRVGLT